MGDSLIAQTDTTPEIRIAGRRSLLAGAVAGWLGMAVSIVLGVLITPVIIRTLGNESYGLWGLVASLVGFYGLFDFGLSAAVARFLGNALGANDLAQFNRVASTGRGLLTGAGALVVVVGLLMLAPAQHLLNIPAEYAGQFRMLVILSALNIGTSLATAVYGGALLASEDFLVLGMMRIASAVLRSFGGLAVVLAGGGVVGLAIATLVVSLLEQAAGYWRCRRRVPQMRARLGSFERATAWQLVGFASATAVAVLAEFLRSKLDVTLVTRFGGLEQAGLYTVGLSVFMYYWRSAIIVAGIISPRLNRLYGSGDAESLRTFFHRASHLVGALIAMMSGALIGLAPVAVRLWVGPGYESSAVVIRILALGFFLDLATNPAVNSFYATGRHRYFAAQSAVEAVCSFTLAYVLGLRFGMYGVAAGIVIPVAVIRLTVQPWAVSRVLSLSFARYWLRCVGAATLAMLVLAAGLAAATHGVSHWGWWLASLAAFGSLAAAMTILWTLLFEPGDRDLVIDMTRSILRRLAGSRLVTLRTADRE